MNSRYCFRKACFSAVLVAFIIMYAPRSFAQEIGVTRIGPDVLVLHPENDRDYASIRQTGGNVVVFRTNEGLLVIDSFTSEKAAERGLILIRETFPGLPVKFLVNSHHHSDHNRGNSVFSEACIIAHSYIVNHEDVHPDIMITSDMVLNLGSMSFEILHFGTAHTDNDLVILDRKNGVLVMSDLLFCKKSYIMNENSDAENWIALLNHIIGRRSEYDHVIPGHGGIVLDIVALREQRKYLVDICTYVQDARKKNLDLEKLSPETGLKKYADYLDFDKIGLDIEAYWKQLEKRK